VELLKIFHDDRSLNRQIHGPGDVERAVADSNDVDMSRGLDKPIELLQHVMQVRHKQTAHGSHSMSGVWRDCRLPETGASSMVSVLHLTAITVSSETR
jgi:hypothetical protein